MRSYFHQVDFDLLAGQWHLQREIYNQTPEGGKILTGELRGVCSVDPLPHGAFAFNERGTLMMPNRDLIAGSHANYIYEFWPDHGIKILRTTPAAFEPKILHELDLKRGVGKAWTATHTHQCGRDHYTLTFNMVSPKKIEMDYVVRGARNNYDMHTALFRR